MVASPPSDSNSASSSAKQVFPAPARPSMATTDLPGMSRSRERSQRMAWRPSRRARLGSRFATGIIGTDARAIGFSRCGQGPSRLEGPSPTRLPGSPASEYSPGAGLLGGLCCQQPNRSSPLGCRRRQAGFEVLVAAPSRLSSLAGALVARSLRSPAGGPSEHLRESDSVRAMAAHVGSALLVSLVIPSWP